MDAQLTINTVKAATVVWLSYLACRSAMAIAARRPRAALFPIIVLFWFFALPLALDLFVGAPSYDSFPGLREAAQDTQTTLLYCVTVSLCGAFLWIGRGRLPSHWARGHGFSRIGLSRTVRAAAAAGLLLPFAAVFMTPDPRVYLSYAAVLLNDLDQSAASNHAIVALATVLALGGYAALMLSVRRLLPAFLVTLPFVVAAAWTNGKRYFVAYVLATLLYVLWRRGQASGRTLAALGITSLVALAAYSSAYQSIVRNISQATTPAADFYDNFRVDYARDHVVRLALFAELESGRVRILDYRGESALFAITMYVPREWWPEKPLPYAQYLTSAALGARPQMWGWGLTTSIIDESIANAGLWGICLAPILLLVICRVGDASASNLVSFLSPLIACALLVVQLSAFGPVFVVWVVATLWERRLRSRKTATPKALASKQSMCAPRASA